MSICSHLCLMMEVQSPHSHSWGRTTCWMEGKVSAHPRNVACEKKIQAGVLLKSRKLKPR